jgi:hypothetical protein
VLDECLDPAQLRVWISLLGFPSLFHEKGRLALLGEFPFLSFPFFIMHEYEVMMMMLWIQQTKLIMILPNALSARETAFSA